MPPSIAACRTVLPFSTVTCRPSIVSVTLSIRNDHSILLSCISAFLHSCIPAFLHSCIPAFLHSCILHPQHVALTRDRFSPPPTRPGSPRRSGPVPPRRRTQAISGSG